MANTLQDVVDTEKLARDYAHKLNQKRTQKQLMEKEELRRSATLIQLKWRKYHSKVQYMQSVHDRIYTCRINFDYEYKFLSYEIHYVLMPCRKLELVLINILCYGYLADRNLALKISCNFL